MLDEIGPPGGLPPPLADKIRKRVFFKSARGGQGGKGGRAWKNKHRSWERKWCGGGWWGKLREGRGMGRWFMVWVDGGDWREKGKGGGG